MNPALDFIQNYFIVYLWLVITTFVNIVAPLAGSTIVNPVTAYFTDPQRAIGIGGLVFFCTGMHRVYLFRKEIFSEKKNLKMIQVMLPFSILGSVIGGFIVASLSAKLLALLVVIASLYFIIKTLAQMKGREVVEQKETHVGKISVSFFAGFLQGSGMPGSDIRNNYLRTLLSEKSVRAVGSAVSMFGFLATGLVILFYNHLTRADLIFIATVVPILIPAQIYGKKFLDKIPDTHAKIIAIAFSLLGVGLLTYKYLL